MGDVREDNSLGSGNVALEHLARRRSSSTGDLTVCSKLMAGPAGLFRLMTDSAKRLGLQKSLSMTSLVSTTSDSGIAVGEQRSTEEPWSPILRWSNFLQRFLPATEIRQNTSFQEDIDTIEMRFQSFLVSVTTNYDLDEQLKVDFSCPYEVGSQMSELLPREGYFWNIKLHLKRSRNLPNTNAKGRIDPYIKIKYRGKTIRRTRIIFNNRNPVWDETIYVPINNLEYPLEVSSV
ncbi:uncharacterized protein DEA37_0015116 [Paragonimus westermani]|uniref:C2 domain-containing protein n=1 Tax=Paragonimus westermani TaxID=34504 RepID=A0A5J4NI41_9TREM|nr:uncharacterized protein DEA37_0015116 [Paragonimus westermani]